VAEEQGVFGGLPVPGKEKLMRWIVGAGIGLTAVLAVNLFMPFVNTALGLLLTALQSLTGIAITGIVLALIVYLAMALAPAVKLGIRAFAHKLTWIVFEFNPIAPLEDWLDEVRREGASFEDQLQVIGGVTSSIEAQVGQLREKAGMADKLGKQALTKKNASAAETQAYAAGTYLESARRLEGMLGNLRPLANELGKIYDAYKSEEGKLKIDIEVKKNEWEVYQASNSALNSATNLLSRRSRRKKFYEDASTFITKRYASQFGRLQALKTLSREVIDSVDLERGVYSQDAMERWKKESAVLIDHDTQSVIGTLSTDQREMVPVRSMDFFDKK
jgi:hypothetical protein